MPKPTIASDPMYDAFIREVKKRIAQKGYTQAQVAWKIGMKPCNFNLALNKHWFFKPVYVLRLAKLLKIKLDWITGVTPPHAQQKNSVKRGVAAAINALDVVFEKGKMPFSHYEKLREAIEKISAASE